MRYLIFNITVLSALGYLFMASPDQSFANWLGKTPQMFDAARSAGRDAGTDIDPSETAGTALLEAMEPVVEEMLSASEQPAAKGAVSEQAAASQPAAKADSDADNPPVTMRDIETLIRALMETKSGQPGDQHGGEVAAGPSTEMEEAEVSGVRPDVQLANVEAPVDVAPVDVAPVDVAPVDVAPVDVAPVDVAPAIDAPVPLASEPASTPTPAATPTVTPDTRIAVAEAAEQPRSPAPAASREMSDAEIAAAFSQLQKSAAPQPAAPQPVATEQMPAIDVAAVDEAGMNPGGSTQGEMSPPPAPPAFMTPGQRVDSLALMVEELQLMYLERSGG
jgi:hypothetical protein